MAMQIEPRLLGADVAKQEIVIAASGQEALVYLRNQRPAIRRYLQDLPAGTCLAVEATNTFHLALLEEAQALGLTVYVVDGYQLKHYRESLRGRAKTDATDARLLLRYLQHERAALRPWSPPPRGYSHLQRLLRRRATLIQAKVALSQSLKELPELKAAAALVLRQLEQLDRLIQQQLREQLRRLGWAADAARVQALEGIGPITAAALATVFRRGPFKDSNAFIAFLGLDVRARDSGQYRGRRKLTKKGDPELRRLLYLAAMQAARSATWQPFYQRHLARGLSKIQALVILARKLARVAFALMKNQTDYQPRPRQEACSGT